MNEATAAERLAEVVRRRTHLSVTERNLARLLRVADARRERLGLALDAYVARVGEPGAPEIEHLLCELTVGETYFFRGAAQVEALRGGVLPALIAERRAGRALRLRVLSAGCATGEEPYSLVILLRELLPDLDAWDVAVVGLDVNERFLHAARLARYGDWSLRELPEATRARWFSPEPPGHRLAPEVTRLVRFLRHNLAVESLAAAGLDAMDLIVCQNVLYYVEPEARAFVRESLCGALAPGGVLLFGPADLVHADVPGCEVMTLGDVLAYRRAPRPSADRAREPR